MKLIKSKDCNPNYLAKIVQIDSFRPHPNADKLKLCTVDGCVISTSIDSLEGIYVYFPVECVINSNFLKINNLYRKTNLNEDSTKQGFFEEQGRVKCIKLRGVASEGLIMPICDLYKFTKEDVDNVEVAKLVGTEFDTVNNELFVWKYVVKSSGTYFGKNKQPKKVLNILNGQFRYHVDTELLTRNIGKINHNDIIQISWKEHGCVDGSTIINTNKGTFTIKEIVDNKLDVQILAYDIDKNCSCYVPIDNYYKIEHDGDWLEIELENGQTIQITTNNPVWLPLINGYRRADELKIGDTLLVNIS